jgi:hypothetical protein
MSTLIDRLPGVFGPESVRPRRRCRRTTELVRTARSRANRRDLIDTFLLLAIDWMFIRWPAVHVPALSRDASMRVLLAAHLLFGIYWIATRIGPSWRASRIAATWSRDERTRVRIV